MDEARGRPSKGEEETLSHAEWLVSTRDGVVVDAGVSGGGAAPSGRVGPAEILDAEADRKTAREAVATLGQPGLARAIPYDDAAFRATMLRAIRLAAGIALVAAPVVWWRLGWRSAAMLLVGAAISASGLWEWLKLMTAVMVRMDAASRGAAASAAHEVERTGDERAEIAPGEPAGVRPIGGVLVGFFLRLGLTLGVLYVSLRFLNGSVYALAAGLGLGIFTLSVEGIRILRAWSV